MTHITKEPKAMMRGILAAVTVVTLLLGFSGSSAESVCADAGAAGVVPVGITEYAGEIVDALRDGGIVIDPVCVAVP